MMEDADRDCDVERAFEALGDLACSALHERGACCVALTRRLDIALLRVYAGIDDVAQVRQHGARAAPDVENTITRLRPDVTVGQHATGIVPHEEVLYSFKPDRPLKDGIGSMIDLTHQYTGASSGGIDVCASSQAARFSEDFPR